MIALLQRVTQASVRVAGNVIGEIGPGLLVFLGVERFDTETQANRLLERVLSYRIFDDGEGRMNRSLTDTGAGLLLVSQFTLAADTANGTRPGFGPAAPPAEGRRLYDYMVNLARAKMGTLATGEFGAHMQVQLTNDGPVTFWLQVPPVKPPSSDQKT